MPTIDRLAEVVAVIAERDDDFRPLAEGITAKTGEEPLWTLSQLEVFLGYTPTDDITNAVNRAKIAAGRAGMGIRDHFIPGSALGDDPDELYLTKYAALLITLNANPEKQRVAIAQSYFALQTDKQALEDEKRLRTRFDIKTHNKQLTKAAREAGVVNYGKFHDAGLTALYGNLLGGMDEVRRMKGLPEGAQILDYAGSEELAANLFRITQTAAALRRQAAPNEMTATNTHVRVARAVRQAIEISENPRPEELPPADTRIDKLATKVRKKLKAPKPPSSDEDE